MLQRFFTRLSLILFSLAIVSCAPSQQQREVGDGELKSQSKVVADAYLYDAKIVRHGKPTSVRMELYVVADTVYVYGRGYFGKGALHARMTPDSVTAIFPTQHEFIEETIADIISSDSCSDRLDSQLSLARLLADLPDENTRFRRSGTSKSYSAIQRGCPWSLDLQYDTRDKRDRLSRIRFDDGAGTTVSATLRESRAQARVSTKRVTLIIPDSYTRLTDR